MVVTIKLHGVQDQTHGRRVKFSICFPSKLLWKIMGKFNFLVALFTGNRNVALIEVEDLLRKLKSNLKNSGDVKERCCAFEGSEKMVTLTRMCNIKSLVLWDLFCNLDEQLVKNLIPALLVLYETHFL